MTTTTYTPTEINDLVASYDRRGFCSTEPVRFDNDLRRVVTDGISTNGLEVFFVAELTHWSRPCYQVVAVELTGRNAGSVEYLMDEYRTQAEAEAIAARYTAQG